MLSKISTWLLALSAAEKAAAAYNPGSFFQSKTVIIPHDTKRDRGGEDAASSNETMIIVADGVGGWG